MAKKIKRSKIEGVYVDPNLEPVGEERAFEIELDEDTNEIIFVHHYRMEWGDGFNADTEHGFSVNEANQIVMVLLGMIEELQKRAMANVPEKSTLAPIEGNPLKTNGPGGEV